ncbi:MAG: ABC transporter substrate-binding protein [Mycobacterium leprae]
MNHPVGIRRLSALIVSLLLVLMVLAGCGGKSTDTRTAAAPGGGPAAAPAARHTTYPVTVKDDEGNSITLKAQPKRVLSLAPSNSELVFALGLGSSLVGRTDFDDYPAEVKSVPSIGSLFPPNYEKIVATQPDLVLMIGGSKDVKEKLRQEYKLTVLTLQPSDFGGVYADLKLLGVALDAQDKAEQIVSDMQQQVKSVTDAVAKATAKPSVAYVLDPQGPWVAGSGTFLDAIINMAGGTNAVADAKSFAEYKLELLAGKNPDMVVVSNQPAADKLKADPNWQGFKALKEGKLLAVPDANLVDRPGPRLVDGLKWFARTLHPELFK